MWSHIQHDGKTNEVSVPQDGAIGIIMPAGSEVCAYVNGVITPIHHVHVKQGDKVYFEVTKYPSVPGTLSLHYMDKVYPVKVPEYVAGPVYKETVTKDAYGSPDYKDIIAEDTSAPAVILTENAVKEMIKTYFIERDEKMGMDNISDKVNINVGEGRGGDGGGMGAAALVAALGNRNESGLGPAMIAALGQRNQDSGFGGGGGGGAALAAMLANNSNNGMNNIWPIILLALLRGRGGFGGDDGDCGGGVGPGHAALLQTLLEGQSSLRAEVPTAALEIQNAIQGAIGSLALGTQQGFSNVKDAVQNGVNFLDRDIQMVNQNVSGQGCQTREWVSADGDRTRSLLVARFQQEDATRIAALNAEVIELRNENRRRADHDDLRIQISNTNTANATQAQGQAQFQLQAQLAALGNAVTGLQGGIIAIGNQVQRVRADQDIVNLGTMVASGTQATTSTAVR